MICFGFSKRVLGSHSVPPYLPDIPVFVKSHVHILGVEVTGLVPMQSFYKIFMKAPALIFEGTLGVIHSVLK